LAQITISKNNTIISYANLHYDLLKFINYIERKISKNIDKIADEILEKNIKTVLISGPSSSGKTTFTKRLKERLNSKKIKTFYITMDDFFVNRINTPKLSDGRYDFDNIKALDVEYFKKIYMELINLEKVKYPKYNFIKGEREYLDKKVQIDKDTVIIIEGIHAFNPIIEGFIKKPKLLIFIEPEEDVIINDLIFTSKEIRLMRRIVRDMKYRGHSIINTLNMWDLVKLREEENIYPYKNKANYIINSSLIYEVLILKSYIEQEIRTKKIDINIDDFNKEKILKISNSYFKLKHYVPYNSILREFIG